MISLPSLKISLWLHCATMWHKGVCFSEINEHPAPAASVPALCTLNTLCFSALKAFMFIFMTDCFRLFWAVEEQSRTTCQVGNLWLWLPVLDWCFLIDPPHRKPILPAGVTSDRFQTQTNVCNRTSLRDDVLRLFFCKPFLWVRSSPPVWGLCSAGRCSLCDGSPATADKTTRWCRPPRSTEYAALEGGNSSTTHAVKWRHLQLFSISKPWCVD